MLAARGDHLMFCDVDFSMPMEEIGKFLALLDAGAPIVIASRELATSQRHHEPVRRHVMGRVFNRVVQVLVVHGIADTQCGFKAFQRPVGRDLFSMQRSTGWLWGRRASWVAPPRTAIPVATPGRVVKNTMATTLRGDQAVSGDGAAVQ